MGIFRSSEVWNSPAPGESRTFHVTAGVTRVTAVQVTNSTGGELWIRQGSKAPSTAEDADFVIPPRATANYPLDTDQISVTWNGLVQATVDIATFAFTDQEVTPAVYPGVEPITIPPFPPFPGPVSSPVQRAPSGALVNSTPYFPTTTSGKNIGALHIYNPTHKSVLIQTPVGTNAYTIDAYTWRTIPINAPSGGVRIVVGPEVPNTASNYNAVSVVWTDIDYTAILPTGGGLTFNQNEWPIISPGTNRIASFSSDLRSTLGYHTLRVLNPGDRLVVDNLTMSCRVASSGVTEVGGVCQIAGGFDGLGGAGTLIELWAITDGNGPGNATLSLTTPIVITNRSSSSQSFIRVNALQNGVPSSTWGVQTTGTFHVVRND